MPRNREEKFKELADKRVAKNTPHEKIKELEKVIRHCKHTLEHVKIKQSQYGNVIDAMASVRRTLKIIEKLEKDN